MPIEHHSYHCSKKTNKNNKKTEQNKNINQSSNVLNGITTPSLYNPMFSHLFNLLKLSLSFFETGPLCSSVCPEGWD